MNSRLCPSHWLIYSSQRTSSGGNESLHSPLLLCLFLSFVIFLKAAWRKPTTDASMSCPQWRRRWRVSALESCGGGRRRSGPGQLTDWLTDWLRDMQLKTRRERQTGKERDSEREREGKSESGGEGGGIWTSYMSDVKLFKSMQGQDRCFKWSSASVRWWQCDGHLVASKMETN